MDNRLKPLRGPTIGNCKMRLTTPSDIRSRIFGMANASVPRSTGQSGEARSVAAAIGTAVWFAASGLPVPAVSATPLAKIEVPSGQDLFSEHCAQCHGAGGTGDGPMAKVLNITPADLTAISKRAGGKFPADRVSEIIRYGGNVSGHGSQVMPIWGKVFSNAGGKGKGGGAYSRRAVIELLRYLETIQKK